MANILSQFLSFSSPSEIWRITLLKTRDSKSQARNKLRHGWSVSFCDAEGARDAEMGEVLSGLPPQPASTASGLPDDLQMALLSELRLSFPSSA